MPTLRSLLSVLVASAFLVSAAGAAGAAGAGGGISSLTSSPVTIYGAKWCSACRTLETGLTARNIAFEVIDVDANAAAFARARAEAGTDGAIPLTSVVTSNKTVWIVGANVDAVDRASRGE